MDALREIISEWQKSLLQLDRRNNLLYFKQKTKSAIWIDCSDHDQLVEDLVSSRNGLAFDYAEKRRKANVAENDDNVFVKEGDLKTSNHPPLELQKRLKNLASRAREFGEEQGISVLYIAIGFLKWHDEQGEEALSPLLMLPVTLHRDSPRDPYQLNTDSDDFELNGTLSHKLNLVSGKQLPELDVETRLSDYLNAITHLVAEQKDWLVIPDVVLTTFMYSKLAMWKDLDDMRNESELHPLIEALAGKESQALTQEREHCIPADESLRAGQLDEHTQIDNQFTILGADYSQVIAVEKARAGSNLIIHGPPGTGKSQTIANIIATLIAEGKSILFVSEKTAALDVVKRRLDECNLGLFCLDLHSLRGKKDNVYEQLRVALDDGQEVTNRELSYTQLTLLRSQLNLLVRALHTVREPFGKSVYFMHGLLSAIHSQPNVTIDVKSTKYGPEHFTYSQLESLCQLADKIASRPEEYRQHQTSVWKCLKDSVATVGLADRIKQQALSLTSALTLLSEQLKRACEVIGDIEITDAANCQKVILVLEHLATAPDIEDSWLQKETLEETQRIVNRLAPLSETLNTLETQTSPYFTNIPAVDSSLKALDALQDIRQIASTIARLIGNNWETDILEKAGERSTELQRIQASLSNLIAQLGPLVELLKLPIPNSTGELTSLLDLIQTFLNIGRLPESLIASSARKQAINQLRDIQALSSELDKYQEELTTNYSIELAHQVDKEMLIRWRTDHQSFWGIFSKAYKSDMRLLKGHKIHSSKITPIEAIATIELSLKLCDLTAQISTQRSLIEARLPNICNDPAPDWHYWRNQITSMDAALESAFERGHDIAPILSDPQQHDGIKTELARVRQALELFEKSLAAHPTAKNLLFAELIEYLPLVAEKLTKLDDALQTLSPLGKKPSSLDELTNILKLAIDQRNLEETFLQAAPRLDQLLGKFFSGNQTKWDHITEKTVWCEELLRRTNNVVSKNLLNQRPTISKAPETYKQINGSLIEALDKFKNTIDSISNDFEEYNQSHGGWYHTDFSQLKSWAENIANEADTSVHWVQYQAAVRSICSELGESLIDNIHHLTKDAKNVPSIIRRRLIIDWLEYIYQSEPILREFATVDQKDLIERFCKLDRHDLPQAARNEVRKRVFNRLRSFQGTSGKGTILGQIAKKRRRMPIRKLIAQCDQFIQTLKPCFMMSPLAVSQLLPRKTEDGRLTCFDVVIFDEASQIFPEDAIPAISRGKQLIVVGDERQLPPTSFFKRMEDDGDDEDEENGNNLQDVKSILDGLKKFIGHSFEEQYLRVHYRSKSDALIRFSNHSFYSNKLLIFPSSERNSKEVGIIDHYLQEGRFDAGSTRRNTQEAAKVVDLVIDHMTNKPPSETLGVVALSRAQAVHIDDLVQEARRKNPHLEQWFKSNSHEPFFVKNLENVQGDERDHIILSIGYGPTLATGKLPQRFGPINATGGQYRLNVAITRARKKFSVIRSIHSGDITSEQIGARLLSQFLSYIQDPEKFFEGQLSKPTGDVDSEFEQSVLQALTEKGYIVHAQVGCAGYWIDLAVLADDGKSYDVGIECDGAAYHSSPAARDRDWLRQSILEELGWTIHRVWSTSWIRDPGYELTQIIDAINQAKSKRRNAIKFSG